MTTISLKTHKLLWGASGNACAICKITLVEDATFTDDASLVGEEAHIVSKKETGPRYDDPLLMEQRDKFENLILLCNRCHKIVDDQVNTYPVELLQKLKKDHEAAVRQSMTGINEAKLRDDLVYSEYVQQWEAMCKLDNWLGWTTGLTWEDASFMQIGLRDALASLNEYLLNRVWPQRYSDLEQAFHAFRRILNDLLKIFGKHSSQDATGIVSTDKFYSKTSEWLEDDKYFRLVNEYEFHTNIIRDLTLELTRAANLICDLVRRHLSPSYHLQKGRLAVDLGMGTDLSHAKFVPQYVGNERTNLYPGFEIFLKVRFNRDYAFERRPESEVEQNDK